MAEKLTAARHVEPTTTDHDWRITDKCSQCRNPVFTMRRGTDFGRQEEHTPSCKKNV